MADIIPYPQTTRRWQQHFFLNTEEIPGIQSIDIGYTNNSELIKYLGMSEIRYMPTGPQVGNFSLNSILVSDDQFIQYTGEQGFNGYILRTRPGVKNNLSFTSGYLTSYNTSCSIGQIPQVNIEATILGNLGRLFINEGSEVFNQLSTIQTGISNLDYKIAAPGSITVSLDEFNTNRVNSYSLSINVPRSPVYQLGNRAPSEVKINWPIEVLFDFSLDLYKYNFNRMKDYPCNPKFQDVSITLKDFHDDSTISSFAFDNMELLTENYTVGAEGNGVLNLQYRTYITE